MKTVKIKLNEDYKQFRSGYEAELQGDLIILSGVNGSGKSQLMQILSGNMGIPESLISRDADQRGLLSDRIKKYLISSQVSVDDEVIPFDFISKRSFKDNIEIKDFEHPPVTNSVWHKEQAWINFSQCMKWDNLIEYSKSKKHIGDILSENGYSLPILDLSQPNDTRLDIDEHKFKELLPDDFVWRVDDPFSETISNLFYESAAKRVTLQAEHGRGIREGLFDNQAFLQNAPWTILNRIFETLRFSYRFKEDIEYEMPYLKEPPTLYTFADGVLDEENPRALSELSDGEKTIINLTFALLNENQRPDRIMLLDEFDNTLNPSLIKALFTLLEEYFLKNGVVVILTTHSPVTISLAPEYASFYEIFRQNNDSPLIKAVGREEYEELRIANESFYSRIENSEGRIAELEEKYQEIADYSKILFVEDKYTQIYKLAWLKLNGYTPVKESMESDFDRYAGFKIFSKGNKDSLYGYLNNPSMEECENQYITGLFDFDDAYLCFKDLKKSNGWGDIQGTEEEGLYRKRQDNISALVLPVPEYRKAIASGNQVVRKLDIELLFTDEQIKKIYNNDYAMEKITSDLWIPKINNKCDFWKKAIVLPASDYAGFKPLFNRINELLNIVH